MLVSLLAVSPFSAPTLTIEEGSVLDRHRETLLSAYEIAESESPSP